MCADTENELSILHKLKADPRFSYAYEPAQGSIADAPLIIVIHGSDRDWKGILRHMREGLGQHNASIVAPLFPAMLDGKDHGDGYKFLKSQDIDYIALMQDVLLDLQEQYGRPNGCYLIGFSGGAQFAQRYALFAASQLNGLVLAAPGGVTLPDETLEWWPGLKGAEAAIGYKLQLPAFKELPVEIIIGDEDLSAGLVDRPEGVPHGSAFAGIAGKTRLERARRLHADLNNYGLCCGYHELNGIGHTLKPTTLKAAELIARWIDGKTMSREI